MKISHQNNFDFLRILFASFVIFTHAFPLTGTPVSQEYLFKYSHRTVFSEIGLAGFFSISGYLIFQSFQRSKSLYDYFKKRILRIYPGLFVALVISVIVGFFTSALSFNQYFGNQTPYRYVFLKILMFANNPQYITGVFEHNPFFREVNGSLWTIPYEFFCYIIIASLALFTKGRNSIVIALFCFLLLLRCCLEYNWISKFYLEVGSIELSQLIHFSLYFLAGSVLNVCCVFLQQHKKKLVIAGIIFSLLFFGFRLTILAQYIALPVLILSAGLMQTRYISGLAKKIGDPSYGIYIYGFLIQQTLSCYFTLTPLQSILLTVPIAFLMGFLSWKLIEKPFLRMKATPKSNNESQTVLVTNFKEPIKQPLPANDAYLKIITTAKR